MEYKNKMYIVLEPLLKVAQLPPGNYSLNVWNEGTTYNHIDTESGVVSCTTSVPLSCGCCHDYEQSEVHIKDLGMLTQCEILIALYENNYNKLK